MLAGGRYDGLIESLGGPATPGVGWAAGIERLAMLLEEPAAPRAAVCVIPREGGADVPAMALLQELRAAGAVADMAYRGNLKRRMARADAQGAAMVALVGADGAVTAKLLATGQQVDLSSEDRDAFLHAATLYSAGVTDGEVDGNSVLEEMIGEWRGGLWQVSDSA